jgi:hypothetical protein
MSDMLSSLGYFAGLALVYWILTLPRTAGPGVLGLFAMLGGLIQVVHVTVFHWLPITSPPVHVMVMAVLDVALWALPLYILFFRTTAGEGATLFDGLALGAALGFGFALVQFLLDRQLGGPILGWPPGAVTAPVEVAGVIAWVALLGFGLVAGRRLRTRWRWWPVAPALAGVLVFVEWSIVLLRGAPEPFWYRTLLYAYWLIGSGRGTGWLLVAAFVAAVVYGEIVARRALAVFPTLRLTGEPATPSLLGEIHVLVLAAREGRAAIAEARQFFAARRRLATVAFDHGVTTADGTASGLVADTAELVADQMSQAEQALAGLPVQVTEESPRRRGLAFFAGLVFTIVAALLSMAMVATMGAALTASLGRNPMGYVYATACVTGLLYAAVFWRGALLRAWETTVAPRLAAAAGRAWSSARRRAGQG